MAVADGRGTLQIADKSFAFSSRDIHAIPGWNWRSLKASEDCFLFFSLTVCAGETRLVSGGTKKSPKLTLPTSGFSHDHSKQIVKKPSLVGEDLNL